MTTTVTQVVAENGDLAAYLRQHVVSPRVARVPGIVQRRSRQLDCWRELLRSGAPYAADLSHETTAREASADALVSPADCDHVMWAADALAFAALNGQVAFVELLLASSRRSCREGMTPAVLKRVRELGHTECLALLQREMPEMFAVDASADASQPVDRDDNVVDHHPDPPPSARGWTTPANLSVSAAHVVFTDPPLLSTVGAFTRDPVVDRMMALETQFVNQRQGGATSPQFVIGLWPRLAIIRGDLALLQRLHRTLVYWQRHRPSRYAAISAKLSFAHAMWDAAAEGRVDMLSWLQRQPQMPCRPDALAAAARSGWSDVVEWLLRHRPETTISLSEFVLGDVIASGCVDVLRVLLEQPDVALTTRAIEQGPDAERRPHVDEWRCFPTIALLWRTRRHDPIVREGIRNAFVKTAESAHRRIVRLTERSGTVILEWWLSLELDESIATDGLVAAAERNRLAAIECILLAHPTLRLPVAAIDRIAGSHHALTRECLQHLLASDVISIDDITTSLHQAIKEGKPRMCANLLVTDVISVSPAETLRLAIGSDHIGIITPIVDRVPEACLLDWFLSWQNDRKLEGQEEIVLFAMARHRADVLSLSKLSKHGTEPNAGRIGLHHIAFVLDVHRYRDQGGPAIFFAALTMTIDLARQRPLLVQELKSICDRRCPVLNAALREARPNERSLLALSLRWAEQAHCRRVMRYLLWLGHSPLTDSDGDRHHSASHNDSALESSSNWVASLVSPLVPLAAECGQADLVAAICSVGCALGPLEDSLASALRLEHYGIARLLLPRLDNDDPALLRACRVVAASGSVGRWDRASVLTGERPLDEANIKHVYAVSSTQDMAPLVSFLHSTYARSCVLQHDIGALARARATNVLSFLLSNGVVSGAEARSALEQAIERREIGALQTLMALDVDHEIPDLFLTAMRRGSRRCVELLLPRQTPEMLTRALLLPRLRDSNVVAVLRHAPASCVTWDALVAAAQHNEMAPPGDYHTRLVQGLSRHNLLALEPSERLVGVLWDVVGRARGMRDSVQTA
ncbi:hypothetical protein P43SY_003919 [Pythium insidiosum]|uniref:Ankyrin repeat protein n=1 Tax=Pythium insidiosum TaxID=114742 RepID=A0AAD5Q7U4_PYTIN|nr:hypothetical protein P43SY_003919 [Pythium insidiosum]